MTSKKPCPAYDESLVEKIDYVPESHPRNEHCWSGGFFVAGRRNPDPSRAEATGSHMDVIDYDGLGALATFMNGKACAGCQRQLPLSAFSPKPGKPHLLRSRCNRCLERSKTRSK